MADLLDEMWTVMRWHVACAVVFGIVYGWSAVAVIIAAGAVWCGILAIIPARKARPWTPPK